MKEIQAWLGHSTYSTTANYYAHLDSSANEATGKTMAEALRSRNFSILSEIQYRREHRRELAEKPGKTAAPIR